MKRAGGGGILIGGVCLIILCWVLQSGLIEWLLDMLGFMMIIAGIILGVYGLIRMFSKD